MKIKKYEVELLKFIELYKELSRYCKNGVILTPYTDGFNNLDYEKKSFVEKMNENNISGFVALAKDYFIHETNKDENQWKFWGCKVSHLKNLIEILSEYNLIMRIDNIKEKFENFYGKNNIRFSSLSDDEDANGGKIERFEIIINNKEAVTLEAYEDGEVDVIIDDIEVNRDNITLYYEFMDDEQKNQNRSFISDFMVDRASKTSLDVLEESNSVAELKETIQDQNLDEAIETLCEINKELEDYYTEKRETTEKDSVDLKDEPLNKLVENYENSLIKDTSLEEAKQLIEKDNAPTPKLQKQR